MDTIINEANYKKLGIEEKQKIQMYLTARQFKNAILIDEMITIPAFNNMLSENSKINFGNTVTLTARGNKVINKIYPFIVNKSFACEVYLKLILLEEKFDIEKNLKRTEKHNLYKLYSSTSKEFKEMYQKVCLTIYGNDANNEFLNKEIIKISNVFMDYRYLYERFGEENIINHGFLNAFCNYLDVYTKTLIKNKYNYDVDLNIM